MECAESIRVQAYFDGEVDALSAMAIERHIEQCSQCRALLQHMEQTRVALRGQLTSQRAPAQLRARILHALDREGGVSHSVSRVPSGARGRMFWVGALSGLSAGAIAVSAVFWLMLSTGSKPMLDDLVADHVRSLMSSHLIDVESTDQHTVKPWFAGRTEVSPVVADFTQQGYHLLGGRADYLNHQRAAVVVYQHGPHIINVFSWAATERGGLPDVSRNGYHMAFWKMGNVEYCAVSDTGWDELRGLVRLLRTQSANDQPQ